MTPRKCLSRTLKRHSGNIGVIKFRDDAASEAIKRIPYENQGSCASCRGSKRARCIHGAPGEIASSRFPERRGYFFGAPCRTAWQSRRLQSIKHLAFLRQQPQRLCARGERLDACRLVIVRRVHFRRNGRHLHRGADSRIRDRISAQKPSLEALRRQHYRHSAVKIANAIARPGCEDAWGKCGLLEDLARPARTQESVTDELNSLVSSVRIERKHR